MAVEDHIYSGQHSSGFTVSNFMYVHSGGSVTKATVRGIGISLDILSGGYANRTNVEWMGSFYVHSGGTATRTSVGLYGKAYVSGGKLDSCTVASGGELTITSGASATNLDIASGALLNLTVAPNTYIQGTSNSVSFEIKNGTLANYFVDNGSVLTVTSGGYLNSVRVNSQAGILITSGANASNISISAGGVFGLVVAPNTYAKVNSAGTVIEIKNSYLANAYINSGSFLSIESGGSASNISFAKGAIYNIDVAPNTYFSGNSNGTTFEMKNAKLSNHTLCPSGVLRVYNGGYAYYTNLYHGGSMSIGKNGKADKTIVNSYSVLEVSNGGSACQTSIGNGGKLSIQNGGYANNAFIYNDGSIEVYSGGVMENTTYLGSGHMFVYSGGLASNTVAAHGQLWVDSGAKVQNLSCTSTAVIHLFSGAVLGKEVKLDSGARVSAYTGSIVDFTVAGRTSQNDFLINDITRITWAKENYSITVNTYQGNGEYKLAREADDLNVAISIGNGKVNYGSLTINGEALVYNGASYKLECNDGDLTLKISGAEISNNDLDGNGLADVILVHTKQGYSGTWLTTGTTSVIKWGNLGNVNSKVELVGTGNVYGSNEAGSDIFMKIGTTVAAWTTDGGKVTGYKELYTLKSNMNMLGIGDFDGDGVTDYLLRSTAGDLGYVTGDDNKWHYIKGLGKEWKIAAVCDLDGNGTDDVIVRHDAGFTGAYMIDTNGKITWSNLDTLKSDMTLVGTGDFNDDGVDDVLLQNKSNGWVGAWLVEDGRVDSFIGICNNKNSIEQIADFNGDGIDDIRIRTEKGDIGVLYVKGADTTEWKYFQSVGKEWDTSFALLS